MTAIALSNVIKLALILVLITIFVLVMKEVFKKNNNKKK